MSNSLDIIFCFRDKEVLKVKNALDSLSRQENKNFGVIFIDYGSSSRNSEEIKKLCASFPFCRYEYINSEGKMWSRADALNWGFHLSKADFVFTADVDLLFKKNFTDFVHRSMSEETAIFFSVGYLSENNSKKINLDAIEKLPYQKS